eukprot:578046-Amphidinium_carterae.1
MSLEMHTEVCPPAPKERDHVLVSYCQAYQNLTASDPMQSRELLEGALQEGCFGSSDEITTVMLLLLGTAHKALGNKEKMHELYAKAFALCRWKVSSMSINERSTARARGIFTTRRCVDAED